MEYITVNVENASEYRIEKGTSLFMLLKLVKSSGYAPCEGDALGAILNNQVRELSFLVTGNSEVRFIDLSEEDGKRIYRRSVHFVFIKAAQELFPEKKVSIRHSISKGIYFEIDGPRETTSREISMIRRRMQEIVAAKLPFRKHEVPLEQARKVFLETGREDKFNLIEHRDKDYVSMYELGGIRDYFYGYMVPNTGYLKQFRLAKYKYGAVIVFPERNDPEALPVFRPQPSLFRVIREHEVAGCLLECRSLGDLNCIVRSGGLDTLIEKSEYLHSVKIRDLATEIKEKRHKLVFIAGPSSSGKTSTALRIAGKLAEMSVKTITISMDDYYRNKKDLIPDESGEIDLESIDSLDLSRFKLDISELLAGKETLLPYYDFSIGMRRVEGRAAKAGKRDVIVVEGIHGLNPAIHRDFSGKQLFRIYVSSLTSMNLDDHNRIPTTDTRLLRRIVRDRSNRGASAQDTIQMWPSVRRGEERNIFPFQENADAIFNTSLYYELAILKPYADKVIAEVDSAVPEYSEARRMEVFLSYVQPGTSEVIPGDSILREFIGGSSLFRR